MLIPCSLIPTHHLAPTHHPYPVAPLSLFYPDPTTSDRPAPNPRPPPPPAPPPKVPGGPDPPLHIEAVLNPLSRGAQRLSALLLLLRQLLGPSMALALNPQRDITEMPLKSYYRWAAGP